MHHIQSTKVNIPNISRPYSHYQHERTYTNMRLPRHIGIIPDGNRRWAVREGMDKADGYDHGIAPGMELFRMCRELGVEEMTFYGFSGAARPEGEPSGFAYSPVYRRKIDLDTFVYLVPRAVRPETVELRGTLLKLDPLRRGFFRLVSQSLAEVSPVPAGEEKQKEMIRSFVKPPFAWVYVGLKSGLYVCYPYHDDCDDRDLTL